MNVIARPTAAILKKVKYVRIIGHGINSYITEPFDSAFEALKKGGKGYSKNVVDALKKKRAVRQATALAETPEAELTTEQKELRTKQIKMVDDFLLEDIYTRNRVEIARGGIADLEGFK